MVLTRLDLQLRIYLNSPDDRSARFTSYRPESARLQMAFEPRLIINGQDGEDWATLALRACEEAFYLFNADLEILAGNPDGLALATAYRAERLRSLSVGDVVAVQSPEGEWGYYACDSVGFRSIARPPAL